MCLVAIPDNGCFRNFSVAELQEGSAVNRIDRLMGIVTVLQAKQYVSAEFLSAKFAISIRTVYRDIKALGEIGVPVGFEPAKGYFIVPGYFLPPVAFSMEEANALVLMETLAEKYGDSSIQKAYSSALAKVKAVMRTSQKAKLEQLHSQIKVYKAPDETQRAQYLSVIQKAIVEKTVVEICYRNKQGKESIREIEPIGLTYYGLDWHIIAWCWLRHSYRDFKCCNVLRLHDKQTPFKKTEHIDVTAYILSLQ